MNRNIIQIIEEYNKGRDPKILFDKYKMMASSAFRFYRGTCHLFYQDFFQAGPKLPDPTRVWLCGDLHMENFGVYKGENQLIYFDINDFDESTLGGCTLDIARFISSLYLSAEVFGLKREDMDGLAQIFLGEFTLNLSLGKAKVLEEDCATGYIQSYFNEIRSRTRKEFLKDWIEEKGKGYRFKKTNPKTIPLEEKIKNDLWASVYKFLSHQFPIPIKKEPKKELSKKSDKILSKSPEKESKKLIKPDNRIIFHDAVIRKAGTGSLGLKRYLVLASVEGKLRLIDIKEAQAPSINLFQKSEVKWKEDAERICRIQEMVQAVPPSLLGELIFEEKNYVVRALQPDQDKLNFLEIKSDKIKIEEIIRDMAGIAASAYLRSSGWKRSSTIDDLQFFSGQNSWQKPLLDYSKKYTLQVEKDYQVFKKALESGKFKRKDSLVEAKIA